MDWSFLGSTRFWCVVVGAALIYLKSRGWIGEAETILINTILAGYVAIRTVDKAAAKIGGQ